MTCAEFQRVLPDGIDEGWSAQQKSHLGSCSACSSLVEDLNAISREARLLRACAEPSPRVWDSIADSIQEIESELDLVAAEARALQASEEPSPRVWNAIASAIQEMDSELELIASEARALQASDDPSVRVWNSLEIALRKEGLIRQPRSEHSVIPFMKRWRWAWMVPVTAAVLIAVGFLNRTQPSVRIADVTPPKPPAAVQPLSSPEDQQVLEAVSRRAPALRATYEDNLRSVNAYIQDAEESVKSNPNDEQAEQYLMDAYEQRAMVYEMALDRALP